MSKKLLNYLLFALLATSLSFVGCSDSEDEIKPEIVFSSENRNVEFSTTSEQSQSISFYSTVPWKITNLEAPWVELSPTSGGAGDNTITITLLDNTSPIDLETTPTIVAGTAQESFKITFTFIQVDIPISNITILQKKENMLVGKTVDMSVTVEPQNTTDQVEWSSSNNSIASVDEQGVVTAHALGTTTITAASGEVSDVCEVQVVEEYATGGDGRTYTFEALSNIPSSDVTVEDGAYIVNTDFVLTEGDILKVENNDLIKLHDKINITIEGVANFAPSDTATITRYDDTAEPKSIYFTGETSKGTFKNITLIDVPIRHFGHQPTSFDNCTFKDIQSRNSAITVGSTAQTTITNCQFLNNGYPAISHDAKTGSPIHFENNYLYKNSSTARNRPQINIGPGGDNGQVKLIGNTVIGPGEITTCGGIAVSNLLGVPGANKVIIENNHVSDCRYGITTVGMMDVEFINNTLVDNKYDSNPMSGGSGISLSSQADGQKVKLTGNTITGHHWGITIIGNVARGTGPDVNLGNLTEGGDYNPGLNTFKDNGNSGQLYDLFNNTSKEVYAQGNTWNVAVQDEESIEGVITHKADDPNLGLVIFMPPAE